MQKSLNKYAAHIKKNSIMTKQLDLIADKNTLSVCLNTYNYTGSKDTTHISNNVYYCCLLLFVIVYHASQTVKKNFSQGYTHFQCGM